MKDGTKIALILGGLWLFNKGKKLYNNFDNLRFGIAKVGFMNFDPQAQSILFNIDFKIFNPYNLRLMFYSIDADIFFNDKYVGKISSNVNRYIYENTTSIIPISLLLEYRELGAEIWNHILAGGRIDDWRININGIVNVQRINMPLKLQFVFSDFIGSADSAVKIIKKEEVYSQLIEQGMSEKNAKEALKEHYIDVLAEQQSEEVNKVASEILKRWALEIL